MRGNIKPIETIYKGYRFRSRLEARWAVFFDAAGHEWTYEEQGYDLDGERYLPDFLIADRVFVEIKRLPAAGDHFASYRWSPNDAGRKYGIWRGAADNAPIESREAAVARKLSALKPVAVVFGDPLDFSHIYFSNGNSCPNVWPATVLGFSDVYLAGGAAARQARFEHGARG